MDSLSSQGVTDSEYRDYLSILSIGTRVGSWHHGFVRSHHESPRTVSTNGTLWPRRHHLLGHHLDQRHAPGESYWDWVGFYIPWFHDSMIPWLDFMRTWNLHKAAVMSITPWRLWHLVCRSLPRDPASEFHAKPSNPLRQPNSRFNPPSWGANAKHSYQWLLMFDSLTRWLSLTIIFRWRYKSRSFSDKYRVEGVRQWGQKSDILPCCRHKERHVDMCYAQLTASLQHRPVRFRVCSGTMLPQQFWLVDSICLSFS